jgi:hypothetical protein
VTVITRQKAGSETFDKATSLKGLNRLKQRIQKMAPGSKITWLGELTGADGRKQKGTEKLALSSGLGSPRGQKICRFEEYRNRRPLQAVNSLDRKIFCG